MRMRLLLHALPGAKLLFPAEPERDPATKQERIQLDSAIPLYSGHSGPENAIICSIPTQLSEQDFSRNPEFRRNNQYPKQDRKSNSGKQCISGAVIPCLECFQLLHTLLATSLCVLVGHQGLSICLQETARGRFVLHLLFLLSLLLS